MYKTGMPTHRPLAPVTAPPSSCRGGCVAWAISAILVASAAGCGPRAVRDPALAERELFLCCTLHFNKNREANDANYVYERGTVMRAGTRIRVVGDDEGVLLLRSGEDPSTYRLGFRFGRRRMDRMRWFSTILRDGDPTAAIARWRPEVVAAVDVGQLTAGMTRVQALTARGYPPFHRTESLEADEWLYYENGDVTDTVLFVDGKISTITRGPPPDRAYIGPLWLEPFALR